MPIVKGTNEIEELSCGSDSIQSVVVEISLCFQGANFLTSDGNIIVLKDEKTFNVKE